jgi:hypothetical protein
MSLITTSLIHFDVNIVADFLKGMIPHDEFESLLIHNVFIVSLLVEYDLLLG